MNGRMDRQTDRQTERQRPANRQTSRDSNTHRQIANEEETSVQMSHSFLRGRMCPYGCMQGLFFNSQNYLCSRFLHTNWKKGNLQLIIPMLFCQVRHEIYSFGKVLYILLVKFYYLFPQFNYRKIGYFENIRSLHCKIKYVCHYIWLKIVQIYSNRFRHIYIFQFRVIVF